MQEMSGISYNQGQYRNKIVWCHHIQQSRSRCSSTDLGGVHSIISKLPELQQEHSVEHSYIVALSTEDTPLKAHSFVYIDIARG